MVSDNVPQDEQDAEKPSATLIAVHIEHVDQLVLIACDLAGFVLYSRCRSHRRSHDRRRRAHLERRKNDRLIRSSRAGSINAWHLATAGTSAEE